MNVFRKPDTAVLLLRESQDISSALRLALETASDAERPGLERALALVAEAAAVPDAELRGRWARRRMAASGYSGPWDSVAAVKALRQAEPGLGLLQAVNLSKDAAATAGATDDAGPRGA